MLHRALLAFATLATVAGCASNPSPDALLARAEAAMGSPALATLVFSARGSGGTFGQAWEPGNAWPGLNYSLLTRSIDYDAGFLREEFGRSRSEPRGGGALPLLGLGEQRASASVRGELAWNGSGAAASAAPLAVPARLHDLWTTPHGVLKAARRHGATAAGSDRLSFSVPGVLEATVWIDAAGLVTRVDSRLPHPVLGDTAVSTHYADYRQHGGVRFPQRIRQTMGEHPVLDVEVTDVKPNAAVDAAVPDAVRSFAERVASTPLAPGVWYLAGGSHHSVLVELREQLLIVESPLYDGRAAAVFAEARRLVPGKPIGAVVNSHHHFDHAGGLRAAAAEGATLYTSAPAKPYFERIFANPNRIRPDRLAASGRQPRIVGVSGRLLISDGQRSVEIHELQGSVHASGFLMVYLPAERLLVQADAYTPAAPGAAPPPVPNANHSTWCRTSSGSGCRSSASRRCTAAWCRWPSCTRRSGGADDGADQRDGSQMRSDQVASHCGR